MTIAKINSRSAERKFTVSCGAMRITDPCYDKQVWCSGQHPVPNGVWHGHVGYTRNSLDMQGMTVSQKRKYKGRVAYIAVRLDGTEVDMAELDDLEGYEALGIDVGVDSGQAGFFDAQRYVGGSDESFYNTICNGTLGDESFASVEFGVASSSGWGDGSYTCYAKRDADGRVVALVIVFIGEDEEDEEDDE